MVAAVGTSSSAGFAIIMITKRATAGDFEWSLIEWLAELDTKLVVVLVVREIGDGLNLVFKDVSKIRGIQRDIIG